MATLDGVLNAGVSAEVDPTYRAARMSLRPHEWQGSAVGGVLGGHYSVGYTTGSMAAGLATNADVFHVWWADPTKLFVLKKLAVQCTTLTAFTTLSGAPLELIIAHNATAVGSGGTALTMNSSNRARQTMSNTAFAASGEIRGATTAALTAPTGFVVETNPMAVCAGAPWLQHQSAPMFLWDQRDAGDHPIVLNRGDVLIVRSGVVGATGVWTAGFTLNWLEVAAL